MSLHAHDLERVLSMTEADFPPTPSMAGPVAARIGEGARVKPQRRRLVPLLAAAAVLALAVTLLASPGARRAVADWLGIGGVRITTDPGESSEPIGDDLGLGDRTTLGEAAGAAGFELRFPSALDAPDEVYVATASGFEQVAAVYGSDEVPRLAEDERMLLMQFQGTPEEAYFKKLIEADPGIDPVTIDGAMGFWVPGPHELTYRGPDGTLRNDDSRLAGNTLVWEQNGVTYRLEGEIPLEVALDLAHSLE